jgi:transposase
MWINNITELGYVIFRESRKEFMEQGTSWTSNNKKKGKGNKKNGNKYLSWAFSEAAEMARRFDKDAKAFYNRKQTKKNIIVAYSALAHKLTRAAYFIMRDQVVFDHNKLFA